MGWFKKLLGIGGAPAGKEVPTAIQANELSQGKMLTVKFDATRMADEIKIDLQEGIGAIKRFSESQAKSVYEAALLSISAGGDLGSLTKTIISLDLPGMTKSEAGVIARELNNRASALMAKNRQMSLGIEYAIWEYSGAPCVSDPRNMSAKDTSQDAAHRAANGKRYQVEKGMTLNSHRTWPGRESGCKCVSRSVIPGLDE